jgi:hypothetical protein
VRRLWRFAALAAAVAGLAACVSRLDIPTPPMQTETQALAAEYDMPTGSVDIASVQVTLDAVNAKLPDLDLDWLPNLASDLLSSLNRRLAQSGLPDDPDASVETHHFILSAVVSLHRICEGFDNPPGPVDSANGVIDATAVVQDGRLEPEVWGTATGCKTNLSLFGGPALTGNATLDGAVIIYLLGPLPTSVSNARFLFQFNGQVGIANQTTNSSIDFRVLDGRLDFRVPVSDGDIVVEVGTGSSVTVRASNGTFVCDLSALSCQ